MVMNDETLKAVEDVGCRIVEAELQHFVEKSEDNEEYVDRLVSLLARLKAYLVEKGASTKTADAAHR